MSKRRIHIIAAVLAVLLIFATASCKSTENGQNPAKTNISKGENTDGINQDKTSENDTDDKKPEENPEEKNDGKSESEKKDKRISNSDLAKIKYSGKDFYSIADAPVFDKLSDVSFESYSELDALGRCGVAFACVGIDLMPTEKRGDIGSVKPSGWQTAKYDCVEGKYLYNRCHLIGYQLSGENANNMNLITGTRYFNVEGMLPFENMVADYVKETKNHVMYRVTPIYDGNDLVAKGVRMEGYSVEDEGDGVCFDVFVFNIQPGIEINYKDGTSRLSGEVSGKDGDVQNPEETTYILNTNTRVFHYPECSSAESMSEKNKKTFTGNRSELTDKGYSPCGRCKP